MESEEKQTPVRRLRISQIAKSCLKITAFSYSIGAAVFLLWIKISGERNWISSILLYVPPATWLLPLIVLLPISLFCFRRLCWLYLAVIIWVFFVYMDFHWSLWPEPTAPTVSLLTSNIGERKTRTLTPFLEAEKPDIIAFQDAWRHGRELSRQNPDRFVASQAQFVLVSKFEIKNSGIVPGLHAPLGPIASWFELDYYGQTIVVYNIHLPTPRRDFENLRGKGFLAETARGRGIFTREVRDAYKKSMEARIRLAQTLMDRFRKEKRPFLVMGDFNAPSQGFIRRIFSSELTDVSAAKGRGYGLTFPGATLNPLSLFGPWLRIDYIFASKDWRPIYSRVEPRQRAQHLAVVGKLELKANQ